MNKDLDVWAKGSGVITHQQQTRERVEALLTSESAGLALSRTQAIELLQAADRLCNMVMWLTVHMTYARNVYLDGRELKPDDFKEVPEGHTGGALNIAPAYVGYLLANALTGKTRSWMMGQGHCVAAVDAANIFLGNLEPEQAAAYVCNDEGLSRLCRDFYGYQLSADGRPAAPLGSHVNAHTGGGISEGGYLGFAELQYMHMPLPGQSLVTFLSDGAFEEQRGSDWAARWWRGEDTGPVMPIMIANGRRIDQRSTMAQIGGVDWFRQHLELNGFEPFDIDGRDPAAFAWAIIHMENRLQDQFEKVRAGTQNYPIRLPYAIAETVKGYGFPGSGTNAAHNLPLVHSPYHHPEARNLFNEGARALFVAPAQLHQAQSLFNCHSQQQRVRERDHVLRRLRVDPLDLPPALSIEKGQSLSPMACLDAWYAGLIERNPQHRFRIGNPDEMRSNRMNLTLDKLQHRVTAPEEGVAEHLLGGVITALNEEAVVSAALANKQGVNLAVSYEAFAVKMLGAMRQEVIFARHMKELDKEVNWISVPVVVTSHTWENGKNEQSHQDPTLSEAWLQEMSDTAPVLFPTDAASAVSVMRRIYNQRGQVATVVVPKNKVSAVLSAEQAEQAARDGVIVLSHDDTPHIQLLTMGAYQREAAERAATRLREHGVRCSVLAIIEPGRFRTGRDSLEQAYVHSAKRIAELIPVCDKRIVISHGHADVITGVLRQLDTGSSSCRFLGYRNRGGTLDVFGMQYANQQSWAHIVQQACEMLPEVCLLSRILDSDEQAALAGSINPISLV